MSSVGFWPKQSCWKKGQSGWKLSKQNRVDDLGFITGWCWAGGVRTGTAGRAVFAQEAPAPGSKAGSATSWAEQGLGAARVSLSCWPPGSYWAKRCLSLHLDVFISKGMAPGKSVSKVHVHLSEIFTLPNKSAELHSGWQSLLAESRKDKCCLNILLTEFLHPRVTYLLTVGFFFSRDLSCCYLQLHHSSVWAIRLHHIGTEIAWYGKFSTVKL